MKHTVTTMLAFFALAMTAFTQTSTPSTTKWTQQDDRTMRAAFAAGTGIDRISYVVFASSWKQKKFLNEKDNSKFVEKLEAEIVRDL